MMWSIPVYLSDLYNSKIAIIRHLPAFDFCGNGRPIFALYHSFQTQGLALAKLLKAVLGQLLFCRDIGLPDMKLKQLLSRVPEEFTRLGIHHFKIPVHIDGNDGVRSLFHQESILTLALLQSRFRLPSLG